MRFSRRVAVLVGLLAGAAAQAAAPGAAAPSRDDGRRWSFSASAYAFLVPDDRDYVNPNLAADHRRGLHLEARYNYEALEAASAWVGWKVSAGEELVLELTPMLGGVFGSLYGIAPGWLLSLTWREFSLYSQNEVLVDVSEAEASFFYTWSELDWSSMEWWRVGLAIQRTKAYRTPLDVQRGFLVGVSYRAVEIAGYVFNLGWTDPTFVVAVTAAF